MVNKQVKLQACGFWNQQLQNGDETEKNTIQYDLYNICVHNTA